MYDHLPRNLVSNSVAIAVLSEGEDGKVASYDERLQKLATVTGLPIEQVLALDKHRF